MCAMVKTMHRAQRYLSYLALQGMGL